MAPSDQEIAEKYRQLDDKLFMSVHEAEALSREMARLVKDSGIEIHKVVGVANGAFLPATIVAERLDVPLEMVRIRRKGSGLKRRLAKVPFLRGLVTVMYKLPVLHSLLRWVMDKFNRLEDNSDQGSQSAGPTGVGILVVDDAIETGQTLKRIMEMQAGDNTDARMYSAVISWSVAYKNVVEGAVKPDFYISKRVQHYPWSQNSNHLADYQAWLSERGIVEWD